MSNIQPMLESALEKLLFSQVRQRGGRAIKMAPIQAGCPDRLVICPDGGMYLVELKTTDGRLEEIQKLWHERLRRDTGVEVIVLYGPAGVMAWLDAVTADPVGTASTYARTG